MGTVPFYSLESILSRRNLVLGSLSIITFLFYYYYYSYLLSQLWLLFIIHDYYCYTVKHVF
jgi:hypothetical protein